MSQTSTALTDFKPRRLSAKQKCDRFLMGYLALASAAPVLVVMTIGIGKVASALGFIELLGLTANNIAAFTWAAVLALTFFAAALTPFGIFLLLLRGRILGLVAPCGYAAMFYLLNLQKGLPPSVVEAGTIFGSIWISAGVIMQVITLMQIRAQLDEPSTKVLGCGGSDHA